MEDEDLAVLLLDTLEQHHYAIHDGVRQVRVRGFGVAAPAADLREHELHKDRQGTLGDRVRYQTPLVVVEVAVRGFHPHSIALILNVHLAVNIS